MLLLNPNVGWYARLKSYFRQRYPVKTKNVEEFWNSQSGDWHWLAEKPLPIVTLNRNLWRASVPSLSFYVLLGLSGLIATLGLLANSVAIIIGAMIIAPLIGPITGVAYSATVANRRLLKRSFLTLFTGVLFTVFISAIAVLLIGLKTATPEILARTNPNLLDLVIDLAAGAAGAFANTRKRVADALPGVAIAVALVPPLSVVGIGLAWGEAPLSVGALLLFITNLTGIIFSGVIILLLQSYGSIERAKQGLIFAVITLVILGVPLGFSLKSLIVQNNVLYEVNETFVREIAGVSNDDIKSIMVRPFGEQIFIDLEITARPDTIQRDRLAQVKNLLADRLDKEIELTVQIVPIQTITID